MTKMTRKELYDKVWTTPMIKLAKEYGISDKGLAKVCDNYQIPKPYRGYWERLQNGYKPSKTAFKGEPNTYVYFSGKGIPSKKQNLSKKEQKRLKTVYDSIESVKFDFSLSESTQTVGKYISKFKKTKDFQGKFLVNGGKQISKTNITRAIIVLNNIEKMTVSLCGKFIFKSDKLVSNIWNHDFEISISEGIIKKEVGRKINGTGYWQIEIPVYENYQVL